MLVTLEIYEITFQINGAPATFQVHRDLNYPSELHHFLRVLLDNGISEVTLKKVPESDRFSALDKLDQLTPKQMPEIRFDTGLSFDDVLLVPQKGVLSTRSEADISVEMPWGRLEVPIFSAPMSSVTEWEMANAMAHAGGLGVIHRFMEIDKQVDQFLEAWDTREVACALGINENYDRYYELFRQGCKIFCIDVAHAHCEKVEEFLTSFPKYSGVALIVGNVATPEGAQFLCDLGADIVKVGIGPGAACSTRAVTGFGVPQLTAIMECATICELNEVKLIADGGIKNSGDIVKALAAGADAVMIGSLFAGCTESPNPGEYFGMASKRVNGHHAPEGVEGTVQLTGPVWSTIEKLSWGIRSGISYAGATNINELKKNAEFIRVAPAVHIESGVRIESQH